MKAKFKRAILICLFGFCVAWMEWKSFGFVDLNELAWLIPAIVLLTMLRMAYSEKNIITSHTWTVFGILCWIIWRFLTWIFMSRAGWVIGLFGILTLPIQKILNTTATGLMILILTGIIIAAGIYGAYWIYKNFEIRWLAKNPAAWLLWLIITGIVGIYSSQQSFQGSCVGLNAYSSSLSCTLQGKLGVIGSPLVSLVFITWILTLALKWGNSIGNIAASWIIAFMPVWIEILINPSRILSVILFKEIRTAGEGVSASVIELNMRLLNLLPIVVFFILIPVGLIYLNTEKSRQWWMISVSAVAFAIILGVLLHALYMGEVIFSYSNVDRALIILMAFQLLLPIILALPQRKGAG